MVSVFESLKFGFNNPNFSDYILEIVHNNQTVHKLHINSLLMATYSKFFSGMMNTPMIEQIERKIIIPVDTEQEVYALINIIKMVYNEIIEFKENNLAFDMIKLCHRIDFDHLIPKICKEMIIETMEDCNIAVENIHDVIFESKLCDILKNKIITVINKEFTNFHYEYETEKFLNYNVNFIKIILSNDNLKVSHENSIYLAVKYYITKSPYIKKNDDCAYKKIFIDLFNCIRWYNLSHDFLINVIMNDEIFTQIDNEISFIFNKKITDVITNKLLTTYNVLPIIEKDRKYIQALFKQDLLLTLRTDECLNMNKEITTNYKFTESVKIGYYYFRIQYKIYKNKFEVFLSLDTKKSLTSEEKFIVRTNSQLYVKLNNEFVPLFTDSVDIFSVDTKELGWFDVFKRPIDEVFQIYARNGEINLKISVSYIPLF